MAKYFYITAEFVMRECEDETQARDQLAMYLPRSPDETTKYMESWEITKARPSDNPVFAGFVECVSCGDQYRNVTREVPSNFVCGSCAEKRFEETLRAWTDEHDPE